MKYILFCLTIFAFASCNSSYNAKDERALNGKRGDAHSAQKDNVEAGDETYIVKTMNGFDVSLFKNAGAFYDGTPPQTTLFAEGEYYIVKKARNIDQKDFIRKLEVLHGVCYACPNEKIDAPKVQVHDDMRAIRTLGLDAGNLKGDPEARQYEYALRITKARNFYDEDGVEKEGAYKAVGYGNNKVVIAIIDTGLNMKHPDFKNGSESICLYAKSHYEATIGYGNDFAATNELREVPIGDNEDGGGHGTHCSGTMCAVEGNNEGIAGVAYKNTYIISYKGLGLHSGSLKAVYSPLADLADIVSILKKEPSTRTAQDVAKLPEAVKNNHANFQITQKIVPVNMSLGGTMTTPYAVEMMNYALAHDILPVVAMGNDGRLMAAYPRSVYGCIPVGATDYNDRRAPFSEGGECISVSAPGFCIISTYNGNWEGGSVKPGSDTKGTQFMSGTSMATPFVTGMLGYLLSFDEGQKLNAQQFKKLLEDTAEKVDKNNAPFGKYEAGHSLYYGYGRVDVLKAAEAITKKNGAVKIPEVDSFYLSTPLTLTTPQKETKVNLYEVISEESLYPLGASYSDTTNKKVHFYGLKKGCKYRVSCYNHTSYKEEEYVFVANGGSEMTHVF